MRYCFIREHQREFRIRTLCRVLGVSRSGYYGWRTRPASARTQTNARLLRHIRRIHAGSRENYGAVKTWEALTEGGEACGLHRVARLRQAHGIQAKRMRRFHCVYAARNRGATAPNLLNRDFTASAPDRVWVGDITFVPVTKKVTDLFSCGTGFRDNKSVAFLRSSTFLGVTFLGRSPFWVDKSVTFLVADFRFGESDILLQFLRGF